MLAQTEQVRGQTFSACWVVRIRGAKQLQVEAYCDLSQGQGILVLSSRGCFLRALRVAIACSRAWSLTRLSLGSAAGTPSHSKPP